MSFEYPLFLTFRKVRINGGSMWHWNQDNFEGLVAIAESIAGEQLWHHFADYCRSREQGLRKKAFQSLTQLIVDARHWPTVERRRFANWIFDVHLRHPEVHQLIATPLNQEMLIPTLKEWTESEAGNATPCRLLGFATGDHQHFADALALNPQDDVSRYRLVLRNLADVDFQCHHLPDQFIGEPSEATATLDSAKEMAMGFVDSRIGASLESEFSVLRSKINDWVAFQHDGGDSFAVWCNQHNRNYEWYMTFYYTR